MPLRVGRDYGQKFILFHRVDLVDNEDGGYSELLYPLYKKLLLPSHVCLRLYDEAGRVYVGYGLRHDLHHILAELVSRLVEAGGVGENELGIAALSYAEYAVARCLRLRADDRYLLAHHRVHEGGFADVRSADNGYHCCFCYHSFTS